MIEKDRDVRGYVGETSLLNEKSPYIRRRLPLDDEDVHRSGQKFIQQAADATVAKAGSAWRYPKIRERWLAQIKEKEERRGQAQAAVARRAEAALEAERKRLREERKKDEARASVRRSRRIKKHY